jgi:ankyrin repeat protein/GTPase SAR1 family protein
MAMLNRKAKGGLTPLHLATKCQRAEFVQLLVARKADTKLLNKDRMSALHTAVCDGTLEVTELLIKADATLIDSQTRKGWTPLHFAAKKNRCDILQLLLSYGGDVFKKSEDGRLPLHVACEVGSLECCRALVESAVDQSSAMVVSKPHNGWTPVFYAVNGKKGGHLNVLKWLVETFSVPIDEQDEENKQTPLHIACRLGFHIIAKYLIDCGAIVSSRNKDGYTPLHWAALYNKEDVVDVLIGNNADVNAQNNEKNTPLHLAKKKGNEAVCKKMISSGRADLSIKNKNGLTPEQVTSEVPPEILSRGEEAIYYYRLALKDGKTKPYRIKLMLLGDAEVGKTSLYRYLTCQEFIDTLERTEGIDTRLISTPEIDPVSDTGWEVMNSPQSEFSDKIAQETVKLVKNAEASKAHGGSHMEEIPEQTKVSVMATSTSDQEQIPQRRIPADSVPPQSMDSSSVAQAAAVFAAVSVHEPKTWKQTETSDTASKQTFRPLSHDQPGTYYSRWSKDQSRYVGARKRHHIADDDVRNDTVVNASPILKPKKKKKKKSQKPDLPQHDFSELPMKDIQRHWESNTADHKSAKVKFYLWDFAGQRLYESMHHTFLTRRAMYIIVLNLAKLTDKGIAEFDLQRIYFWVASVHAHTPLKPEPVRIFFVGTHSKSPGVTQERVAKAIQQLQDWFENSDSFLCHIEYVEHDDGESLLTRVENSSDFEDRNIRVFRNALLKVALEQGYMQEEIPLMWLRYEDEILKFHNQSLSVPVVAPGQQTCRLLSVEDMHNIATKCQIAVAEGSFKTMITFFHDTGLVIYPPAMHGLDLELQQRLENVVMPNPQWLVDLMKVLVNIPAVPKQSKTFRTDWRMLKKEGILTDQLMYHVMHDKQGFPCDQVNTLCLLFQALGFICKLLVRPNVVPSTRQVTEQFSEMSISHDQPQEVSQIAATGGHQLDSCYLVPCQLPESRTDIQELCDAWTESFLFNFGEFLPPWLFQHLIVRLLNHMQTDRELRSRLKFKHLPLLSKKACLMAQNSKVEFIVELLSTRIIVRYQEKLRSYAPQLMKWLVGIVADIVKQKFTNLEFCCGQLCPHISCLKHQVEVSHLDLEQSSLPQLMDTSEMKKLRQEGQSTIKCLQKLPVSKRNALLSMAYKFGHVEESYTYVEGLCDQHEPSDCSFSDIYVSQKVEALSDSTGMPNIFLCTRARTHTHTHTQQQMDYLCRNHHCLICAQLLAGSLKFSLCRISGQQTGSWSPRQLQLFAGVRNCQLSIIIA